MAQRIMGLGVLIGFTATFIVGSPVSEGGALQLMLRAILAGFIFGILGFVVGEVIHKFIEEQLEKEIEMILMQKELKRQEKQRKAEETTDAPLTPGAGMDFNMSAVPPVDELAPAEGSTTLEGPAPA